MGNISFSASLSVSTSGASVSGGGSGGIETVADPAIANIQSVGTGAWEVVDMGDIAAARMAFFKNADPTNFIELALDNAGANKFAKLLPGDVCLLPPSTTTLYAKADTGACNLLVCASDS